MMLAVAAFDIEPRMDVLAGAGENTGGDFVTLINNHSVPTHVGYGRILPSEAGTTALTGVITAHDRGWRVAGR